MQQPQRAGSGPAPNASLLLAFLLTLLLGGQARAQAAEGELLDGQGASIGTVTLTQMARGVHILAEAAGLPSGVHALHIHAVGVCEPPFTSAGGHFNPTGAEHGWNNPRGHHAGDLPNVHVQEDGVLTIEYFTDAVTLGEGATSLFDTDGASIVIHQGADDYESDPAGHAGDRIACAVITPGQ
jgi:superoxide dismutase, Cu-Zn family